MYYNNFLTQHVQKTFWNRKGGTYLQVGIIFHVDNNLFSLSHKGLYLKTYLMFHKECPPWKWVGVVLQKFDFDKQISNNIPAFDFSCITYLVSNMSSFKNFSTELFFFNQTARNNSHAVLGITLGKVINVLFFLEILGFHLQLQIWQHAITMFKKLLKVRFLNIFYLHLPPNYSAIFVDFSKKLHTR